ncbi:MAG: helix-turn-helix domain-containing protein [Pseudomonadota bacterium]|nr:helix-turn-helix domain-containing protein [Pseudomonadota bacterium]
MLRKMTLCRVQPRRTLAVLTTNNKVVVKLQMYSLKPHAETLQALRRLMPQKELRKSAPKLSATGEGLQGSTPALLQVLKTLGDSELSTKLPEVYLEYGQILAMQSQAPIGNLLELFQSMCAQISTSERPFDLHILDDGQVSHCEFFWKKDPTRVPSPELSELLLSYGYTIGSNLLQGLTDQLSVFLPYNAPEHAEEYAKYAPMKVTFGAPYFAVRLPSQFLTQALVIRPSNFQPQGVLRPAHIIAQKASNLLRADLANPPSLNELSETLGLTERTCKRRLQEAGTHYQQLLADMRLVQASFWLSRRMYNVSQVAELLGYSSVANFSKAYKKWSGFSPTHAKQGLPIPDNRPNPV